MRVAPISSKYHKLASIPTCHMWHTSIILAGFSRFVVIGRFGIFYPSKKRFGRIGRSTWSRFDWLERSHDTYMSKTCLCRCWTTLLSKFVCHWMMLRPVIVSFLPIRLAIQPYHLIIFFAFASSLAAYVWGGARVRVGVILYVSHPPTTGEAGRNDDSSFGERKRSFSVVFIITSWAVSTSS